MSSHNCDAEGWESPSRSAGTKAGAKGCRWKEMAQQEIQLKGLSRRLSDAVDIMHANAERQVKLR